MRKSILALIILLCIGLNVAVAGVLVEKGVNQESTYTSDATIKLHSNPTVITVLTSSQPKQTIDISYPQTPTTTKLIITNIQANYTAETLLATISNQYTNQVTINNISVNEVPATLQSDIIVPANSTINLLFAFSQGIFHNTYDIKIATTEGYTAEYYKLGI